MEEKEPNLETSKVDSKINEEKVILEDQQIKNQKAQVIGELAKEKQKGLFGVIVFFIILIGFTIGLPYITEYLKNKNMPIESIKEENKKNDESKNNQKSEELVYYEIDANSVFTVDNLNFSNLNKEQSDDFYLNLTLLNKKDQDFTFKNNYYIELYNSEKTLLERVKLINDKYIKSNESIDLKLLISENSYNNANLLTVVEKTTDDYQEINLINVEDDYKTLSCNNKGRNITYYFMDNKLVKISDVYEYSNNDSNIYNDYLRNAKNETASLNNVEGVSSNIVDTNLSFVQNTQIDLEKANIANLNINYYYKHNTEPKIVKFEMEAMRYTCN